VSPTVVSVVGNPRADSRTHRLARVLAAEVATTFGYESGEVDLSQLSTRVLDLADETAIAATEQVRTADLLVVASPTYKGTYSGLLKAFLDRLGTGSLDGAPAIPILLGGAPNHQLAVDVHFTPLLLELGARVPARGLFVLEADVPAFEETARAWVRANADWLK
jgi:FMN reductase